LTPLAPGFRFLACSWLRDRAGRFIHALGVRHIVNLGLHTHEKALPDEAASVSRLGMTYIHIPVDFQNPTDDDFDQFCAAMEQLKEVPVHVDCVANNRVSAGEDTKVGSGSTPAVR
jgi:protein tyrosine phosphatase (PTP) superfamily phosphohydrolase (DUF442 family)